MSAAQLDALERRRYPVVVEGTWRSVFEPRQIDDEPAPRSPEQMNLGSGTSAANYFGPMHGYAASVSMAFAALTLTDAQSNDVTSLYCA